MTSLLIILAAGLAVMLALLVVVVTGASFWRREDPLPPDMFDGDLPDGPTHRGQYIATYADQWRKPFNAQGFLQGGHGEFYVNERGVHFLIDGSRQPVFLPYERVRDAMVDTVGSGVFRGQPAIVVVWELNSKLYRSAFIIENPEGSGVVADIQTHLIRLNAHGEGEGLLDKDDEDDGDVD
ncbi:MAG: hypothetical protein H6685_12655 [Deltaproteobacteria bacterium]|nr:hypothetical protein [Deltaproteobacteria bacterium]